MKNIEFTDGTLFVSAIRFLSYIAPTIMIKFKSDRKITLNAVSEGGDTAGVIEVAPESVKLTPIGGGMDGDCVAFPITMFKKFKTLVKVGDPLVLKFERQGTVTIRIGEQFAYRVISEPIDQEKVEFLSRFSFKYIEKLLVSISTVRSAMKYIKNEFDEITLKLENDVLKLLGSSGTATCSIAVTPLKIDRQTEMNIENVYSVKGLTKILNPVLSELTVNTFEIGLSNNSYISCFLSNANFDLFFYQDPYDESDMSN